VTALEGELIAVDDDSMYVVRNVGIVSVPATDVRRILLQVHGSSTAAVAAWAVVGTLSTASHGLYSMISAPLWILGSTVAGVEASKLGKQKHEPPVRWPQVAQSLQPFARFPGGLPSSVDRRNLILKPAGAQTAHSPWHK
jgi:hypothetical protein